MRLKKHLGFIGDKEEHKIIVRNPEIGKSNIEIECDDFNMIWELLNILAESVDEDMDSDLLAWKTKNNISQEKYDEYMDFLRTQKYVFCCFDQHNKKLLTEIYKNCKQNMVKAYISAYHHETVFASRLNMNIIDRIDNGYEFVIGENSGIGILGDLGAQMMMRIWFQDIFEKMDIGKDLLEYNFFGQFEIKNTFNLDVTDCNYYNRSDKECKDFYQEKIIYPRLLSMYREYLKSYDENLYEEMIGLADDNEISDFKFDNCELEAYINKINSMYIPCGDETYSLAEFGPKYLLCQNKCDKQILEVFHSMLEKLQEDVLYFLKEKKKKYFDDYLLIWREKRKVRDFLIDVSKGFIDIHFGKEIDFLDYNPMSEHGFDCEASEQLKMATWVDDIVPGYDMREYVKYVLKHNFLDLSPRNNVSCNLKNKRYAATDIIVHYEKSIEGFFQLCHELGHGYYASYFKSCESEESASILLSETLACLNEFLAQITLIRKQKLTRDNYKGLLLHLHGCIIGIFSMDLYEESILRLDEISWENILRDRKLGERQLFGDKLIKNDEYSDYNISLSIDFLFEQRIPYLYPEAHLYGFYLAQKIVSDPRVYYKLINLLNNEEHFGLDISDVFAYTLGIKMDSAFYETLKNEFLSYICFLKNCSLGIE